MDIRGGGLPSSGGGTCESSPSKSAELHLNKLVCYLMTGHAVRLEKGWLLLLSI